MSAPMPSPAVEPAEPPPVPIEQLAFEGASVFARKAEAEAPPPVPAAAPAMAPAFSAPVPEPEVVEIASLAPGGRLPLEQAFDRYRQLMTAAPDATRVAMPAAARSPDAHPAPPMRRVTDLPPVDVRSLCYSGRGALERAAEVRGEITRRLADSADLRAVEPLLRELLDLVPLALDAAH